VDVGTIVLITALPLTTLAALVIGLSREGLSAAGLRRAAGRAADCIGLGLVFYAANLAIGWMVVLALRLATDGFVTLYVLSDTTILALSLLQGLVVRWWWEGAR